MKLFSSENQKLFILSPHQPPNTYNRMIQFNVVNTNTIWLNNKNANFPQLPISAILWILIRLYLRLNHIKIQTSDHFENLHKRLWSYHWNSITFLCTFSICSTTISMGWKFSFIFTQIFCWCRLFEVLSSFCRIFMPHWLMEKLNRMKLGNDMQRMIENNHKIKFIIISPSENLLLTNTTRCWSFAQLPRTKISISN